MKKRIKAGRGLSKKEIEYWRDKLTIKDLVIVCDMKGFKFLDVEAISILDNQTKDLEKKITGLLHSNTQLQSRACDLEKELKQFTVQSNEEYESLRLSYIKEVDTLNAQVKLLINIIKDLAKKE